MPTVVRTAIRSLLAALLVIVFVPLGKSESGYTAEKKAADLASFELIWTTLRDRYWDAKMSGLDWNAVHQRFLPQLRAASTRESARAVMDRMIRTLPSSHLAIIPGSMYRRRNKGLTPAPESSGGTEADVDDDSGAEEDDSGWCGLTLGALGKQAVVLGVQPDSVAARSSVHAGWVVTSVDGQQVQTVFDYLNEMRGRPEHPIVSQVVQTWLAGPVGTSVHVALRNGNGENVNLDLLRERQPGEVVRFGNLPPEHVYVSHRRLESGVGYARLNIFLNPVKVMPDFQQAVSDFSDLPGMVIDLRGNPGGLGMMAMGLAGWFVDQDGKQLGTMTTRDTTLNFVVNPRISTFKGKLAILVDEGSASTSEILAQGLHDLGRAQIFGSRTAGAALPSNIVKLPNGDRFQYPEANYRSVSGRVLEGNGVIPDVAVEPRMEDLLHDRDTPLEEAISWIKRK